MLVIRTFRRTLAILLLFPALVVFAQDNPLSRFNKVTYERVTGILLRSAEKMPEENYSFRPTAVVRSYGQMIGHLADAQYTICSVALGERAPNKQIEQTKTSKAALIAALIDAFAYCEKAYDSMTDASGTQMVNLFGTETPRLDVLAVNNMHNFQHYGSLVTYMRMKNIVPPTSEPDRVQTLPMGVTRIGDLLLAICEWRSFGKSKPQSTLVA